MEKKVVINIIFAALLAGLVGFYGGRYYERQIMRKSFESRVSSREGNIARTQEGSTPMMPGDGPRDGTGPGSMFHPQDSGKTQGEGN